MFSSAFVILIGVALKVVLQSPPFQHILVFVKQPIVIGIVLCWPVAYLCEVVEALHWRLQGAAHEVSPREMSEPWMLLDFLNTRPSQPFHWLPLKQFVCKIGCLNAPALRNIPFGDDYLLFLDLLFDLLP